jgi:hypothetical protein
MSQSESQPSIFRKYYSEIPFVDRYAANPAGAIDVIIPVIHSNELWDVNLRSFYREIPINRLLIADGGCIDDTVEIVKKYPRVEVLDHRNYVSLGYSERLLIEAVETEWFIHLHSDVQLPEGWFDVMQKYQGEYDWYGCSERDTIMVECENEYSDRPWAGAQFGRKSAFEAGLSVVDDDFIYRQGDYLYRRMIEEGGYKEGRITDTFHYHQIMYRVSPWERKVKSVHIDVEMNPNEEVRTYMTMAKGIVKYLKPPQLSHAVVESLNRLQEKGELDWPGFYSWVQQVNPAWLPYLRRQRFRSDITSFVRRIYGRLRGR